MSLDSVVASFKKGRIVVVYDSDGREGEADLMVSASKITPGIVGIMRVNAGGLLCLATSEHIAGRIGLPFMADLLLNDERLADMIYGRTKYGDKPAFSISINHVDAKTGISDEDRAKTIAEYGKIAGSKTNNYRKNFIKTFRTPGHVHLLIGRGIENRKGHTEMSLELARRAGMPPAVAICEITGIRKKLTREKIISIAKKNGWEYAEGKEFA